jgi:mono/diheme cytochrome c family protein
MVIRILNGGYNMPGYGATLQADEVNALVAFLQSRR